MRGAVAHEGRRDPAEGPRRARSAGARLSATPPIVETRRLRTLHTHDALAHGNRFLSSASGATLVAGELVVVADDAHHVGLFPLDDRPGALRRILPGDLPTDAAARKRVKPDFESIARLPPCDGQPHGALLAAGSGSTPTRDMAVILPLEAGGGLGTDVRGRSLVALFAPLRGELGEINVESTFVLGDELVMISRANGSSPDNVAAYYPLDAIARWQDGGDGEVTPDRIVRIRPGDVDGVPLGITDAVAHPAGGWLFTAVAEDTADSYNDGALLGAVLGRVDLGGAVTLVGLIEPTAKVEGVVIADGEDVPQLLMVTDADDPSQPAELLTVTLPA